MPTIWRPTTSTLYSMVTWFSTLATSIESAFDTVIKANGKSVFADATARDAFYTSPNTGDMAVINTATWPQFQMYYSGAWHTMGPTEYGGRVYKTSAQSIASSATPSLVTSWDTLAEQRGGFALDTNGIKLPISGVYSGAATVVIAAQAGATATQRDLRLTLNGTALPSTGGNFVHRIGVANGQGTTAMSIALPRIQASANDILGCSVVQVSGGALSLSAANVVAQFLGS